MSAWDPANSPSPLGLWPLQLDDLAVGQSLVHCNSIHLQLQLLVPGAKRPWRTLNFLVDTGAPLPIVGREYYEKILGGTVPAHASSFPLRAFRTSNCGIVTVNGWRFETEVRLEANADSNLPLEICVAECDMLTPVLGVGQILSTRTLTACGRFRLEQTSDGSRWTACRVGQCQLWPNVLPVANELPSVRQIEFPLANRVHSTYCELDTGAALSVISRQFVEQDLQLPVSENFRRWTRSFSREFGQATDSGFVNFYRVSICGKVIDAPFLVLDSPDLIEVPVLLGRAAIMDNYMLVLTGQGHRLVPLAG